MLAIFLAQAARIPDCAYMLLLVVALVLGLIIVDLRELRSRPDTHAGPPSYGA